MFGKSLTDAVLISKRLPNQGPERQVNEVVWHRAEELIKDAHKADVLLIFDCCYAGYLGRNIGRAPWSSRSFEFLGATDAHSLTKVPGPHSFTSALVWALEQLADNTPGFTTSELQQKITEAEYFPPGQLPVLNERDKPCLRRLFIAPLPPHGETRDPVSLEDPEDQDILGEYLDLRLPLTKHPSEKEIIRMCNSLKELINVEDLPARRVAWGGLFSKDAPRYDLTAAVQTVAYKFQNQALRKRLRSYSGENPNVKPDISKDQPTLLNPPTPHSLFGSEDEKVGLARKRQKLETDQQVNGS